MVKTRKKQKSKLKKRKSVKCKKGGNIFESIRGFFNQNSKIVPASEQSSRVAFSPTEPKVAISQMEPLTETIKEPEVTKTETCINKLGKNKNETQMKKIINLCDVLNGKLIEKSDMNREKAEKFMHLWFNNINMTEEILKTIKSRDICLLHPIVIAKLDNSWVRTIYKDDDFYELIVSKYLQSEILQCIYKVEPKKYIFVVPIIIVCKNTNCSHANAVIVTMNAYEKNRFKDIVIEHFEPNGYMFDNEYTSNDVSNNIKTLFIEIFSEWFKVKETDPVIQDIKFIFPKRECISIQEYFRNSKYEGSCQYVSMIYALHRVIYPELTQDEIYNNITEIFKDKQRNGVLEEYINDVIYSLISLLDIDLNNIDYDNFIINPAGKTKKVITFNEKKRALMNQISPEQETPAPPTLPPPAPNNIKNILENVKIITKGSELIGNNNEILGKLLFDIYTPKSYYYFPTDNGMISRDRVSNINILT
jgi:hypothetical protein